MNQGITTPIRVQFGRLFTVRGASSGVISRAEVNECIRWFPDVDLSGMSGFCGHPRTSVEELRRYSSYGFASVFHWIVTGALEHCNSVNCAVRRLSDSQVEHTPDSLLEALKVHGMGKGIVCPSLRT